MKRKYHVCIERAIARISKNFGKTAKFLTINYRSGSVCLDVINQTWSPMYELKNVFEVFLPQLLLYPNPTDPLNGDAANLMMTDKDKYEQTVSLFWFECPKTKDTYRLEPMSKNTEAWTKLVSVMVTKRKRKTTAMINQKLGVNLVPLQG